MKIKSNKIKNKVWQNFFLSPTKVDNENQQQQKMSIELATHTKHRRLTHILHIPQIPQVTHYANNTHIAHIAHDTDST